jgi:hypothetical protein
MAVGFRASTQPTNYKLRDRSTGLAIPGLIDRHGIVITCDVLQQLVGWQPARDREPRGATSGNRL